MKPRVAIFLFRERKPPGTNSIKAVRITQASPASNQEQIRIGPTAFMAKTDIAPDAIDD
jgi:hypothetical protein